jgi:hypothetical protein
MDLGPGGPPERLKLLVDEHRRAGCPAQGAIHVPMPRWRRWPSVEHHEVLDDLPRTDDIEMRALTRAQVRERCECPSDAGQALRAFLVVMAWGFGTTAGYGPWRVYRAIDAGRQGSQDDKATSSLAEVLLSAALQSADDPVAGYRVLAEHRPLWIGPAFATKYLHFVTPVSVNSPLILDRVVAGWIARHASGGPRLDPVPWAASTYQRYLTCMKEWAADLGAMPSVAEELMFRDRVGSVS